MDNIKGMAWMTLAMLAFALADMFIKMTVDRLPVGEVILFFGVGGALVFGIAARMQGANLASPAFLSKPVLARNASEILGTVCFVIALSKIELATLSSVIMSSPLLVTLGAAVILGEHVGWRRWLAIGIGMIGVLVILRPGLSGFEPAALWAVGAAIGLSGRDLATRPIPREISTLLLGCWGFLAAASAGAVLLILFGGAVMPDGTETAQLFGAQACALVAYYAITAAMRVGKIGVVSPFRYTRLVFAFIIAAVVFGERPDAATLIGAGIVIATGLYTFWRETAARRAVATSPLPTGRPGR